VHQMNNEEWDENVFALLRRTHQAPSRHIEENDDDDRMGLNLDPPPIRRSVRFLRRAIFQFETAFCFARPTGDEEASDFRQ
jgi:hypothetical protein